MGLEDMNNDRFIHDRYKQFQNLKSAERATNMLAQGGGSKATKTLGHQYKFNASWRVFLLRKNRDS